MTPAVLRTIHRCRVCGSSALESVLNLGSQYISSNFETSASFPPVMRKVPLEVVRCSPLVEENACGVMQLRHSVPPEFMYSSYGYRSGVNATMTEHLRRLAADAEQRVELHVGDKVVDIGANDGTLLLAYQNPAIERIGFEPSNITPDLSKMSSLRYVQDFFSQDALPADLVKTQAKIITSIAMFYDVETPVEFATTVRSVLSKDGIWIVEMAYLPTILDRSLFDTVCHEHLLYYSFGAFERVLDEAGLRAVDVAVNDINGGSFRVYACRDDSTITADAGQAQRLRNCRREEFERELDAKAPYERFRQNVHAIRTDLQTLLVNLRDQGKRVIGYGASTKGNVILQYCGIDTRLLECIADRNPIKWGTKTIGTEIPIVSEEEAREREPDFMLVLPWHFIDEFIKREAAFLSRGGEFIMPLPTVRRVAHP